MKYVATDKEAEAQKVKDYIHEAVAESIQLASTAACSRKEPKAGISTVQGLKLPIICEILWGSLSEAEDMPEHLSDYHLIKPYITAIKEAIEWNQDSKPPEKVNRLFPNFRKQGVSFPSKE